MSPRGARTSTVGRTAHHYHAAALAPYSASLAMNPAKVLPGKSWQLLPLIAWSQVAFHEAQIRHLSDAVAAGYHATSTGSGSGSGSGGGGMSGGDPLSASVHFASRSGVSHPPFPGHAASGSASTTTGPSTALASPSRQSQTAGAGPSLFGGPSNLGGPELSLVSPRDCISLVDMNAVAAAEGPSSWRDVAHAALMLLFFDDPVATAGQLVRDDAAKLHQRAWAMFHSRTSGSRRGKSKLAGGSPSPARRPRRPAEIAPAPPSDVESDWTAAKLSRVVEGSPKAAFGVARWVETHCFERLGDDSPCALLHYAPAARLREPRADEFTDRRFRRFLLARVLQGMFLWCRMRAVLLQTRRVADEQRKEREASAISMEATLFLSEQESLRRMLDSQPGTTLAEQQASSSAAPPASGVTAAAPSYSSVFSTSPEEPSPRHAGGGALRQTSVQSPRSAMQRAIVHHQPASGAGSALSYSQLSFLTADRMRLPDGGSTLEGVSFPSLASRFGVMSALTRARMTANKLLAARQVDRHRQARRAFRKRALLELISLLPAGVLFGDTLDVRRLGSLLSGVILENQQKATEARMWHHMLWQRAEIAAAAGSFVTTNCGAEGGARKPFTGRPAPKRITPRPAAASPLAARSPKDVSVLTPRRPAKPLFSVPSVTNWSMRCVTAAAVTWRLRCLDRHGATGGSAVLVNQRLLRLIAEMILDQSARLSSSGGGLPGGGVSWRFPGGVGGTPSPLASPRHVWVALPPVEVGGDSMPAAGRPQAGRAVPMSSQDVNTTAAAVRSEARPHGLKPRNLAIAPSEGAALTIDLSLKSPVRDASEANFPNPLDVTLSNVALIERTATETAAAQRSVALQPRLSAQLLGSLGRPPLGADRLSAPPASGDVLEDMTVHFDDHQVVTDDDDDAAVGHPASVS